MILPAGEIHMWQVELDQPATHGVPPACSLSRAEREIAERFFFEHDRRRFIVRRRTLRSILGRYLQVAPEQLSFRKNPRGKPQLTGSDIHFNVSHSAGLAVYVFGRCCQLGVDIEYLRPMPDASQIAAAFFSPSERTFLEALPVTDQQKAFFHFWTRKEAFVKAIGEGLSYPLDRFDVSPRPGKPAALVRTPDHTGWFMTALAPASGWVGALVTNKEGLRLVPRRWIPE